MKALVLNDGTSVELSDISTRTDMVAVVPKWGDIDKMNLSKENVEGGEFDGVTLDTVFVDVTGHKGEGKNVEAHILTREKTELEKIHEEQEQQNAMINAIAMGGM